MVEYCFFGSPLSLLSSGATPLSLLLAQDGVDLSLYPGTISSVFPRLVVNIIYMQFYQLPAIAFGRFRLDIKICHYFPTIIYNLPSFKVYFENSKWRSRQEAHSCSFYLNSNSFHL